MLRGNNLHYKKTFCYYLKSAGIFAVEFTCGFKVLRKISVMNIDKLTHQVADLSHLTGNIIKNELHSFTIKDVKSKGLHNFVSYVDKMSEEKLVAGLGEMLPEAGFIVEENTKTNRGDRYNWVVDPLDGTTNFIHGIPLFSISIALLDRQEVILGVVYEINLDECFYAWKNSPAFLNGNQIHVSDAGILDDSLIATGFPYTDYTKLDPYLDLFRYLLEHTHGLRRLGSAAVDLAYVACGRFEGFYEYGLNAWDVAAGSLIVKQAGGSVTDFANANNYIFGREILATNKKIHSELFSVIKKYFAQN